MAFLAAHRTDTGALAAPACDRLASVLRPPRRWQPAVALAWLWLLGGAASLWANDRPVILVDGWELQQIASEPDLVTPVSCRFDRRGRLLVVESHTHFPPRDYAGPTTDRIHLFDDSDGDGSLDRQRLFYEGGKATMGLTVLEDDWIVVATRSEVIRIRDTTGDDKADQAEVLLRLETTASYPHNGLAGLTMGPDGYLYVGQGENLGEPYQLIGSDGSRQTGGGEGGNVFRCRPDGSQLERFASGFWNPFGLHFDAAGRLWAVGNDPDARPPCRLLHVVQGADYGFQFRFGRAGTHPLQAWDGDQPGTLPMAAGTGEAPCAVISYGDALWVTSWGDNRIERYRLQQSGASWKATMEVVLQGGSMFRPVDMAVAADGSIYFTDWVDRSYPVHGKGRLWRLVPTARADNAGVDSAESPRRALPALSSAEQAAARLADDESVKVAERLDALEQVDPFIRQAAVTGLISRDQLSGLGLGDASTPGRLIGLLTAWRWNALVDPDSVSSSQRNRWITQGLVHESAEVCRAAIRWAAETGDQQHLPAIAAVLQREDLPERLFAAAVAAIAYLETGSAARGRRDEAQERLLNRFLADVDQPARLRGMAVRMLPAAAEAPSADQLASWMLQQQDPAFADEVVRLLVARDSAAATAQLAQAAQNDALDPEVRSDAVAGLARQGDAHAALLNRLAGPEQHPSVRREALRVLRRPLDQPDASRPAATDLDAWQRLIGNGGNRRAGWRVFTRTTCVSCHVYAGRGAGVGPDLTTLAGKMDRRKILQSILQPSKEVGPLYVSWRVMTEDGRVLVGLKLGEVGNRVRFMGTDGEPFEVPLEEILTQQPSQESVMPSKLQDTLSVDELRDLVAFLADEAH